MGHECLLYLSDLIFEKCSDKALPTLSDALTRFMHGIVQCEAFKETLSEMVILNLCVVDNRIVSRGESLEFDNSKWFAYEGIDSLSENSTNRGRQDCE